MPDKPFFVSYAPGATHAPTRPRRSGHTNHIGRLIDTLEDVGVLDDTLVYYIIGDNGTPVSDDYGASGNEFSGRVDWVQIDLGEDAEDADHLISPHEGLRVAMARQ